MIYLPEYDAAIYEPPRTGTTFCREALRKLGIRTEEGHVNDQCHTRHSPPDKHNEQPSHIAATVRHPVAWIESYWRYLMDRRPKLDPAVWVPYRFFDDRFQDNFRAFVECCCCGEYAKMIEHFHQQPDTYAIHTETIVRDLEQWLAMITGKHKSIMSTAPINVSKPRSAIWSQELYDKWLESESRVVERWY